MCGETSQSHSQLQLIDYYYRDSSAINGIWCCVERLLYENNMQQHSFRIFADIVRSQLEVLKVLLKYRPR